MTPLKLRAGHRGEEDMTPEEIALMRAHPGQPQIMVIGTDMVRTGWLLCTKGDEVIFMGKKKDLYAYLKGELGKFDTMLVSHEDLKDFEDKALKGRGLPNLMRPDKESVQ